MGRYLSPSTCQDQKVLTEMMRMVLRRGTSKYRGVRWEKGENRWRVPPCTCVTCP